MKTPSFFVAGLAGFVAVSLTGCASKNATTVAITPTATTPIPTPTPRVMPAALRGEMMPGVWVLCYHRIVDAPVRYTNLQPAEFEKQMNYLAKNGFNVVPLSDIVDAMQYGTKLPQKTVALTFDDGYKDNHTIAYPILKQHNFPATLFIYPNYISNGGAALTWEQLKTMAADPLISIQSHTYSHSDLGKVSRRASADAKLKHEIIESKNTLEQKLGIKIDFLAYPYGIFNLKVLQLTKAAGYRSAFTIGTRPIPYVGEKPTDMWTVPRIMVNRGDSLALWASRMNTPAQKLKKISPAKKQKV